MASLNPITASMRVLNDARKRVCTVSNLAHDAQAEQVGNFVDALETLYNNGECTARVNIALEVVR